MRERETLGETLRTGFSVAIGVAAVIAGATPWLGRAPARKATELAKAAAPSQEAALAQARSALSTLPLTFEANKGQTDERAKFVARGAGSTLWLTGDSAVFSFAGKDALQMRFVGAGEASLAGVDAQASKSNYLRAEKSVTNVPHYAAVSASGVYPGVDLRWYGRRDKLEYDVVLAPGADVAKVRMALDGASETRLTATGDLAVRVGEREIVQSAPVAYQTAKDGARESVAAAFEVSNGEVGFRLGAYDRSRELVIDPSISWSTFVGGSGDETGNGAAYDDNGTSGTTLDDSVVLVGATSSIDFPSGFGHLPTNPHGNTDAYVVKMRFAPTLYVAVSTYLGGGDYDEAYDVAIDGHTRNIWLCGQTFSSNFPTQSPFQAVRGGQWDAFVSAIDGNGDILLFSTYYGGSGNDYARGMCGESRVVAGPNNVSTFYVTGFTASAPAFFPASLATGTGVNPFLPAEAAPFQPIHGGGNDAFVLHLAAEQIAPFYGAYHLRSSYLGGTGDDRGYDIQLNRATREPHVTGYTTSSDFPRHNLLGGSNGNTIQNSFGGFADAFITRLNVDMFPADPRVWSTYLGGVAFEAGQAIDVDDNGDVAVTGRTESFDLPRVSSFQQSRKGQDDAFVAHIRAVGYQAEFITYFGGAGSDSGQGVAFQRLGAPPSDVYVFGTTDSNDLPTTPAWPNNFQSDLSGNQATDCFVARFGTVVNAFLFPIAGTPKLVTYLGGTNYDYAGNMTWLGTTSGLGGNSELLLCGRTRSVTFPTANTAQPALSGDTDAFATRFAASVLPTYPAGELAADARTPDTVALSWKPNAPIDATAFEIQRFGEDGKTVVATVPTTADSYVDTGLEADTSYAYTVAVVQPDGVKPSNFVQTTTLPFAPSAPTGLAVQVRDSSVSLSWTDASSNETGFEVQRSTGGEFRAVATVAAGVTRFETTEVASAAVDSTWRVAAVNRGGSSEPSNEVSAATTPTLSLSSLKGSLLDAAVAGGDKFSLSGKLAGTADFDPQRDAVRLELGSAESPLVLTIPAAARGWTAKRGVFTWNSAKGFLGGARFKLVLDAKKGTFSLSVTAFDFPAAQAGAVRFGVALGSKAGATQASWSPKGAGKLVLK
jgi:hypothetical protein